MKENDIIVSKSVSIPHWEYSEQFVRASGPGGQNVNKVNTKVTIRFDLRTADWLTDKVKGRLAEQRPANVTVSNDKSRSQIFVV